MCARMNKEGALQEIFDDLGPQAKPSTPHHTFFTPKNAVRVRKHLLGHTIWRGDMRVLEQHKVEKPYSI